MRNVLVNRALFAPYSIRIHVPFYKTKTYLRLEHFDAVCFPSRSPSSSSFAHKE